MEDKIKKLNPDLINKIAAGEVIERPASVVKELIENSIDAKATEINIFIKKGGKELISIEDNGIGMSEADTKLAFERHATSKLVTEEDLFDIGTLGFRGEALASIGSVSMTELVTKPRDSEYGFGYKVICENSEIKDSEVSSAKDGTIISVHNLFMNIPARLKYLQSDSQELKHIIDVVLRYVLVHPEISFKLYHNDKLLLNYPSADDKFEKIYSIFGRDLENKMIRIAGEDANFSFTAYISKPEISRVMRNQQFFYINNRFFRSRALNRAIDEGYKTYLMRGRMPVVLLQLKIDPKDIDVNVHPAKIEIRMKDEQAVVSLIIEKIKEALENTKMIPAELEPEGEQQTIVEEAKVEEVKVKDTSSEEKNIIKGEKSEYEVVGTGIKKDGEEVKLEKKEEPARRPKIWPPISSLQNNDKKRVEQKMLDFNPNEKNDVAVRQVNSVLEERDKTEVKKEKKLVRNTMPELYVLGQVYDTYILADSDDGLMLIDQHALDERIMLEKNLDRFKDVPIHKQHLIQPLVIETTQADFIMIKDNLEMLDKYGFEVDEFGPESFAIKSMPVVFGENISVKTFIDVLHELQELSKSELTQNEINEKIIMMSCKSAIKANEKLTENRIKLLIQDMYYLKDPYHCAHGRPTIINITEKELERRFKRVV